MNWCVLTLYLIKLMYGFVSNLNNNRKNEKKNINKSQIKVSLQLKIKFEFIVVDQGNAYQDIYCIPIFIRDNFIMRLTAAKPIR